ncbi:flagellar hook-length control protein FliK [Pelomonas cellulosilytica]|uniref:Flagellar hook-length control protein FliK n=1 Tax=Pelomonas cellulosilytica TaxID=2906762 RepID=A0ABS8XVW8_9BURK|nr:flagellar hook-length control protein FliK [Pelomonas sp. P8]MCE4554863.1 flagellar hook-length control protein FliK [Pelomonas sp. P8]
MLSSAQTIAPKPAALPPAPQPAASPSSGPSFSQFLTGQPAPQAAPPTPPAPAPAPRADASSEASGNKPPATSTHRDAPPKATAPAPRRPADAPPQGKVAGDKNGKADKTDKSQTSDAAATDPAAADADDDKDVAPQLQEFTQLLGMTPQAPSDTAARPEARLGHTAKNNPTEDDSARTVTGGRATARPGSPESRTEAPIEPTTATPAQAAEARAERATTQASAITAAPLAAAPDSRPGTDTVAPAASFAATLAHALPAQVVAPQADATATPAPVQASLHSAAFAPELGTRVSLMAVDGVQHAELQLNPAEMGPVAVQITVDGSQAQVSFHAAHAETRQVLEQSLPDLAAALQGQGLTLSGGGVFQQARRDADGMRQGADDNKTGTRSGGGGGDRLGATASIGTPAARRTVGLLDTFA